MNNSWKRLIPILALVGLCAACAARRDPQAFSYREPLTSPGTKLSGLPPAVQKSIRAQVGAADMRDINKFYTPDGVVYRVDFRDVSLFPPLFIRTDGSVLNPDLTVAVGATSDMFGATSGGALSGVRFSDLPVKVARAVQDKAPTAEVAYITTITVNNLTFYQVSFRDPQRDPRLLIREDGTIVDQLPDPAEAPVQPLLPKSPPSVTVP